MQGDVCHAVLDFREVRVELREESVSDLMEADELRRKPTAVNIAEVPNDLGIRAVRNLGNPRRVAERRKRQAREHATGRRTEEGAGLDMIGVARRI